MIWWCDSGEGIVLGMYFVEVDIYVFELEFGSVVVFMGVVSGYLNDVRFDDNIYMLLLFKLCLLEIICL